MKLYLSPGACSLADHIALHEAGLDFDRIRVDLKTGRTEDGRDYSRINPTGYVPAVEFDDGEVLTENIAILSLAADKAPGLTPDGPFGRFRLLEMLAFISTEIHKAFKPFFKPDATEAEKAAARDLDLTATALRDWVRRAPADRTQGRSGLTPAERDELARLRKENRELRTERDILKKAAAFFAKHQA